MTLETVKARLENLENMLADVQREAMSDGHISWLESIQIKGLKAMVNGLRAVVEDKEAKGEEVAVQEEQQQEEVSTPSSESTETTTPIVTAPKEISASVGKGGVNKEDDVRLVQQLLNQKGASLVEDGDYGNNTYKAIVNFQKSLGFRTCDGRIDVGGKTWAGLAKGATAPVSAEPSAEETTTPTATTPTTPTAPVEANEDLSASVGKGGKNLAADVALVQQKLNAIGAKLTVSGQMDAATQEAINYHQASIFNGWSDGVIGAGGKTWKNLKAGTGSAIDPSAGIKDALDDLIDDESQGATGLGIGADEDDEYKSQRDNQTMVLRNSGTKTGDSQCNVTSLAMLLIAMNGGDEAGVIEIVKDALKKEKATIKSSWGLEELLAQYTDTQGMAITSSSNMGKLAKRLFSHKISDTQIIEVNANTVLQHFKNTVIPSVKKGAELIISARFTSGGHIVFLRSIKSAGPVLHDPYGLCIGTGIYMRNQKTFSKSKFEAHEEVIKRRLSLNGRFEEIKQKVMAGEALPNDLGTNNFYSWDDFVGVSPYRLIITHKK